LSAKDYFNMSSTAPPPIALEIKAHNTQRIKALLSYTMSMDCEDNINVLKIGVKTEKVNVPH